MVQTTGPSKVPKLPELLRWKVITVPAGVAAGDSATGCAKPVPAHSVATSVLAANAKGMAVFMRFMILSSERSLQFPESG